MLGATDAQCDPQRRAWVRIAYIARQKKIEENAPPRPDKFKTLTSLGLVLVPRLMRSSVILAILILTISLSSVLYAPAALRIPAAQAATTPTLEVWNPQYGKNLTNINPGSNPNNLQPGTMFDVLINVTNAGPINGFDVNLNYNITTSLPNVIQAIKIGDELSPGLFDPHSPPPGPPPGCQVNVLKSEIDRPPGRIRFAATILGGCSTGGTGTLFRIHFKVVGVGVTSIDIVQASHGLIASQVIGPPPAAQSIPVQISGADFRNKPGLPPVAQFTYFPSSPSIANNVAFNATGSYDPDNQGEVNKGIQKFLWDFDDASVSGDNVLQSHVFLFTPTIYGTGYFSVKLVVIDADNGLPGRLVRVVYVNPGKVHDLAVSITLDKSQPSVGESVGVQVTVSNRGNQDERASLNVTYDFQGTKTLGSESNFSIPLTKPSQQFSYTLHTDNLTPRVYTITGYVNILGNATDANPQDNLYTASFTLKGANTAGLFSLSLPVLVGGAVVALAAAIGAVQIFRHRKKAEETRADAL